jgi:hypothetical protein
MSRIFDKEIRITEDEHKEKKRKCSNYVLFFVSLFIGFVAISIVLRIFMVISGAI